LGHRSFADVVKSPILSSANAVPLGSHRRPAMTVTGTNAVHLGPHRRSAMSARKQSVFDRLIFPRVAAHSSSSKEVSPQTRLYSHCLSPLISASTVGHLSGVTRAVSRATLPPSAINSKSLGDNSILVKPMRRRLPLRTQS
jgi:hypothetical protein